MIGNKDYKKYLENLRAAFHKVTDHPEYVNKTYNGESFYDSFDGFVNAWIDLSNYGVDESKDPNSFYHRLQSWVMWDHNVIRHMARCIFYEKRPFDYPEVLEAILDQTYKFLHAKTKEEALKILDTRPILDGGWIGCLWEGNRLVYQKWLTSGDLGMEGEGIPAYYPCDVTLYERGKKLEKAIINKYGKDSFLGCMAIYEQRDRWKVIKRAIKKKLIVDNYRKNK